jgi:hypothetical protein
MTKIVMAAVEIVQLLRTTLVFHSEAENMVWHPRHSAGRSARASPYEFKNRS